MGSDKAKLRLHSQTLLETQVGLLQSLLPQENVYVSGAYDGFACIPDLITARGPIGGIYSALQKFISESVLMVIVPVDMPHLEVGMISKLLEHAMSKPDFDVYRFDNFEMPLLLRNTSSVYSVVNKLLHSETDESRVSIRSLLRELKVFKAPRDDDSTFQFNNLNTRQDFEKAVANER